jgi:hypothetical protein
VQPSFNLQGPRPGLQTRRHDISFISVISFFPYQAVSHYPEFFTMAVVGAPTTKRKSAMLI